VLSETRQHLRAQSPAGGPALPDDDADPATLDLLAAADVLGVSQLETPGMRRLLRQIRPKGVADLVQALAVTRPGAAKRGGKETFLKRRSGAEPVTYAHPALEPVLKENRGVILFDDDVLGVIEALTGLPAVEADRLRKRLTDAGQAEEAGAFLAMLEKKGVGRTAAALVLDQLTKFRDCAFCKSHAVAYALVAWQECFARAHYPVPFWCAVLNHHHGNYPRRVYVEAAKRSGVGFHLPCVNRSQAEFTQEVGAVRTGLSAVRSLDPAAVGLLLEERRQAGPFRDMSDFRRRVTLTPQDLALLVRAGCFDFSGRSRESLLQEAELTQLGKLPAWWEGRKEYEPWPLDALSPSFALASSWRQEWELLGFLAGPPLLSLARSCVPPGLADSRSLEGLAGQRVKLAGLLATPLEPGEEGESQLLALEDEYGLVEVRTAAGVGDPPGRGRWCSWKAPSRTTTASRWWLTPGSAGRCRATASRTGVSESTACARSGRRRGGSGPGGVYCVTWGEGRLTDAPSAWRRSRQALLGSSAASPPACRAPGNWCRSGHSSDGSRSTGSPAGDTACRCGARKGGRARPAGRRTTSAARRNAGVSSSTRPGSPRAPAWR
jgi:hypothetical protein